jgi:hypothetical protein
LLSHAHYSVVGAHGDASRLPSTSPDDSNEQIAIIAATKKS